MKVLIVANNSWNVMNFRKDLVRSLIKKNVTVHILSGIDDTTESLKTLGCKFSKVNFSGRGKNIFNEFLVLINLYFFLKRHNPDFVLSFTIKPNIYVGLISRLIKVRQIANITGLGKTVIENNFFTKVILFLYKTSLTRVHTCFFQNKDDLNFFVTAKLIDAKKTKLIPGSGINLDSFDTSYIKKAEVTKNKFTFIFVGRILREKGIIEFLAAANDLIKAYQINIIIVGKHNKKEIDAGVSKKFEEGIKAPNIDYLGFVADVVPQLKKADCLVLPSYREGSSRAIIEAMALSIPVIASDVPGCNNLVENKLTGYLCQPRNVKSLKSKMDLIINLPKHKRLEMGAAARYKVEEEFDVNLVISSYFSQMGLI